MYEIGTYVEVNDCGIPRVGKLVSFSEAVEKLARQMREESSDADAFLFSVFHGYVQRGYIYSPLEYYVLLSNGRIKVCSKEQLNSTIWVTPDYDDSPPPKTADRKEYRATGVEPAEEPFAQPSGVSPLPDYRPRKKKFVNHGLIDEFPPFDDNEEVPEMRTPQKMPMGGSARRGDLAISASKKSANFPGWEKLDPALQARLSDPDLPPDEWLDVMVEGEDADSLALDISELGSPQVKVLWIVNAVSTKLLPEHIAEMAQRSDVTRIKLLEMKRMIQLHASRKSATKSKAQTKSQRKPVRRKSKLNPESVKYVDKVKMPGTEKLKTGPQTDKINVRQDQKDGDGKYDWGLCRKALLEIESRELLR